MRFFTQRIKRRLCQRRLLELLPIGSPENMVPDTAGNSEIHVWELMMNEVVSSQLSIPGILEIEMMMNMVTSPIENESGQ